MERAVRAASAITTLTQDHAARVTSSFPGISAPLFVVPQGVDVTGPRDPGVRASVGVPDRAFLVVHVAGLRSEKGFPDVWPLVDGLRRAVPVLRYVWIGPVLDESIAPECDAFFASRPWAVRLGALPRERTLDILAAADVTLHASRVEGTSNALLESMALGSPPLARDTPASRAVVVDGRTGFLFASDDDAARAVANLAADASLRSAVGAAARAECASRFSVRAELEGCLRAYAAAMGGANRPRS